MIKKILMKKLVLLTAMVMCFLGLQAQKNYAVMVSDAKTGKAIAGAAIHIKSTGTTVTTSESGNVVISAPPDDSVMISFRGYHDRKISLTGQSVAISIVMEPKPKPVVVKPKKKRN
jgi:hypothetical protein